MNSLYVLATRAIWAFLFTGLALALRRDGFAGLRKVLRDPKERRQLAVAGLAICANWGLYIWAVGHDRILDSSLANYLNPILAIALGVLPEKTLKIWSKFSGHLKYSCNPNLSSRRRGEITSLGFRRFGFNTTSSGGSLSSLDLSILYKEASNTSPKVGESQSILP